MEAFLSFLTAAGIDFFQGAQEVFQELPFEYVDSKDLAEVAKVGCESFSFRILQFVFLSRFVSFISVLTHQSVGCSNY